MRVYQKIGLAVGLQVLLVACAGATYRYYFLSMEEACYQSGKLLGPTAGDDLSLATCQPDAENKAKCYVYPSVERERLVGDLLKCQSDLKVCQGQ